MRSSSTVRDIKDGSRRYSHVQIMLRERSHLDTGLRTLALVLAHSLRLVAALAGGVAGAACAAVHLALGAGFFGHGGGLVGAVDGGVLRGLLDVYHAIV